MCATMKKGMEVVLNIKPEKSMKRCNFLCRQNENDIHLKFRAQLNVINEQLADEQEIEEIE